MWSLESVGFVDPPIASVASYSSHVSLGTDEDSEVDGDEEGGVSVLWALVTGFGGEIVVGLILEDRREVEWVLLHESARGNPRPELLRVRTTIVFVG